MTNTIDVVMESEPGTCDLYGKKENCCKLAGGGFNDEVFGVLFSFLSGCGERRRCRAIDLGANAGWMTTAMLSLGATVVSVEPQADLAAAINATAKLNCWAARSTVINARACGAGWGKSCLATKRLGHVWRSGGGVPRTVALPPVPGVPIEAILFAGLGLGERPAQGPLHIDFIKADGDGPEGSWLRAIDHLLARGVVSLGAIVLEGNGLPSFTLQHFDQQHGFDVYRIDTGFDKRRLITSTGWDAFSPRGTIGTLDRVRSLERDALEEEMLNVRAVRHLFRIKRNLTRAEWETVLRKIPNPGTFRWARNDLLIVNRSIRFVTPLAAPARAWSPEAIAANYTPVDYV